jgi:hypothetical protein
MPEFWKSQGKLGIVDGSVAYRLPKEILLKPLHRHCAPSCAIDRHGAMMVRKAWLWCPIGAKHATECANVPATNAKLATLCAMREEAATMRGRVRYLGSS